MHNHQSKSQNYTGEYLKLIALIVFIIVASWYIAPYIQTGQHSQFMSAFMGTFFLVFGLFKLVGLKEFAGAFQGYDLIAKKYPSYGYLYPFLELWLALGYFTNIPNTTWATLALMTVSSIGVLRELRRGGNIKCACLGTIIKLPLTSISLTENVSMGIMALLMILNLV